MALTMNLGEWQCFYYFGKLSDYFVYFKLTLNLHVKKIKFRKMFRDKNLMGSI